MQIVYKFSAREYSNQHRFAVRCIGSLTLKPASRLPHAKEAVDFVFKADDLYVSRICLIKPESRGMLSNLLLYCSLNLCVHIASLLGAFIDLH